MHTNCLSTSQAQNEWSVSANLPFYTHKFWNRQAVRRKNIAGLSIAVPSLSVSVTGLSVIVYGLSVSLPGLLVVNFPDMKTFTDRPVKVTKCMVCFPAHSLFGIKYSRDRHISDKLDTWYRQACFINQARKCHWQHVKLTDRPVARWMNLGSVTRVRKGRRDIKHIDILLTAWKLQPTVTDHVANGLNPEKT